MKYPDRVAVPSAALGLFAPEIRAAYLEDLSLAPADAGTAAVLRAEIIGPLVAWMDAEEQKGAIPPYAGPLVAFIRAAEDLEAECLRCTGRDVPPEPLEALAAAWAAWAHEMGAVLAIRGTERAAADKGTGARGGSAPKRRAWAEETARELAKKARGLSEAEAWDRLPESGEAWEIELLEADFIVYRDGDKLHAEYNPGRAENPAPLKRSTFLKNYFRKAR